MKVTWWWSQRSSSGVGLTLFIQEVQLGKRVRRTLQDHQCVCALVRTCVCQAAHMGWQLKSCSVCYAEAICLVYYRSKVTKKQIQPTWQAAQWQLPLTVLIIILTLLCYRLISLPKLQPDLTHGGRVVSSSDRIYTNYCPGCVVVLAFSLLVNSRGKREKDF